jgi:hypothetical protein
MCNPCPNVAGISCNKTAGICLGCGTPTKITEENLGIFGPASSDFFGTSVAVSGGTMLVSVPGAFSSAGAVYALTGSGTSWGSATLLAPQQPVSANYAQGLALSGSNAVIGGTPGTAMTLTNWLFQKIGPSWFPQGTPLVPPSGTNTSFFPNGSLAIDGSNFVSGAFYGATIYTFGGAGQQVMPDYTVDSSNAFGFPVAISGNTALIGGEPVDSQGQTGHWAYVFVKSGSTWALQTKLVPSDLFANAGPHFRFNLAIDGDTAVIATTFGAYVFSRSGTTWTQTQKIVPPIADNLFGSAVALKGNTMVIGAYSDVGGAGEAYLYGRSNGTWILGPTLTTGINADSFGISVSLSQGTVVIGASSDSDYGNSLISVGAAYVYTCAP